MEFIAWWFDTHYIASTIFTPGPTLIWCMYSGLFVRGVTAILICILFGVGNHGSNTK